MTASTAESRRGIDAGALARRAALGLAAPLLALLLALVIASIALWLSHNNPFTTYKTMIEYGACARADASFPCRTDSLVSIINRAVPLYLSAVAVGIGFKMGLFNIGVDGQYRLAALMAAAFGAAVHLPAPIHVAAIMLVAVLVGALWAGIAGALRVTRGVSEVISTIMLNFIATGLAAYLLDHPFAAPHTGNSLQTRNLPPSAHFPGFGNVYGFLVVAVVVGIAYHVVLSRTRFGFDLRATGLNPFAARASGVGAGSMVLRTMLISGAIAGLVGLPDLLGSAYNYSTDFPSAYGFAGIAVALLGRNNAIGMGVGALLFGFLDRSAQILDLNNIPKEIVQIMEGATVLSVVVAYEVVRRANVRRAERAVAREIAAPAAEEAAA